MLGIPVFDYFLDLFLIVSVPIFLGVAIINLFK